MVLRQCVSSVCWRTLGTYSRITKNAQMHEAVVDYHTKHSRLYSNLTPNKAFHHANVQFSRSSVPPVTGIQQESIYSSHCPEKGQELSSAGQEVLEKEYHCPSKILEKLTNLVILDRAVPGHAFYDLPVHQRQIHPIIAPDVAKEEITEPPSSTREESTGKLAKEIMKIRHKKMKKHKLRKLRKRMYFVWRKKRLAKINKRNLIFKKELEDIRSTGENFDPREFVKVQLQKAKRGGYYINVFESKM